jgi:lysine 2,3-aminomutase
VLGALPVLLPRRADRAQGDRAAGRHGGKKKGLAKIPEVCGVHPRRTTSRSRRTAGVHPETGREKLREILLSGGDPMVLNNSKIAAWLAALAEAGVESIRIGTKEMAFYPQRFDDAFLVDARSIPRDVPPRWAAHDAPLRAPRRDPGQGRGRRLCPERAGLLQWVPATAKAMRDLVSRGWMTVENQTPIIKGINDDPDALRILQREFKRAGGENHYFFCGRDIVAYKRSTCRSRRPG